MKTTKFFIVLLISMSGDIFQCVCGIPENVTTDLRWFKVEGLVGRFVVNRDALERAIQNKNEQNVARAQDVNIQLPLSLPNSTYNTTYQGEAMFMYGNITDEGLARDLSEDLKERVAMSYRYFDVNIPVVIGDGNNGILSLCLFTDSAKQVLYPYHTTINDVIQVDSIEETDDGNVTLRLGDDVMALRVQRDVQCDFNEKQKIGKDFDKIMKKVITTTSYPSQFDWGCKNLGPGVSFCEVLNEVGCDLSAVNGDVCTLTSTTSSKRCLANFAIVEMTGRFREMVPFLAEMVPSESFEAESIEREHTTGIVYPCLTPHPTL